MTALSIINATPKRLDGPNLLHSLIHGPSNEIALEHAEGKNVTKTTYSELHSQSLKLSYSLLKFCRNQARPIIPVLVPQSPDLYIGLLAVLKAGAAFCPLNLDAPKERIKFILHDVSAKVVLTTRDLQHNIPRDSGVSVVLLDAQIDSASAESASRSVHSSDLAYVMYTSGSTGTPKGVAISHEAVTQALLAHDSHIPSFSRFLQFAAPTFDVSVFEIFFPLYRGSTLISAKRSELLDDLPSILTAMRVDACELTPTVAASLLRERRNAPGLKLLLTIGEMLNDKVIQEFGGSAQQSSILWAMYGPTEATIHCTLQPAMTSTSNTCNIGRPLDTTSCFIIEPLEDRKDASAFRVLPRGQVGELAVGGYQLATEYLNSPDKTASAFIHSPYGRLYRTGDRARIADSGQLECLGRLSDGQVKVRGQRIELGEVESTLLKSSGCDAASALVIDSVLVAFCCTNSILTEDGLISTCQKWLPRSMIPGDVIIMKEFPMLPSGKVDKKTLTLRYEQIAKERHDGSKEHATTELMELLSDTLKMSITEKTTLNAAGVDSLTAITLASSLRNAGFNASGASILQIQTFGELFRSLGRNKDDLPDLSTVPLSTAWVKSILQTWSQDIADVDKIMCCTALQTSMIAETMKDSSRYWNTIELMVDPQHSVERITDALYRICQSNESLRSRFAEDDGLFYSVVSKSTRYIPFSLLNNINDTVQPWTQFSISTPVQFTISQNNRILIHIHHAIYDGWSNDLLISDLSDILSGAHARPRPQFSDVARHLQNGIKSEQIHSAKAFWAEYLHNWSKPTLPKLSARRSTKKQINSQRVNLTIDPLSVSIESKLLGVTPQAFFQAALFHTWSGVSGSDDVLIGSVTSGRTMPVDQVEDIMGPCIASLPLRIDLSKMKTCLDVLQSISYCTKLISQHDCLSLAEVRHIAEHNGSQTLYDILFVYQESIKTKISKKNCVKEYQHLDNSETKLIIEIEPRDSAFALQATYHEEYFPSEFVTTFVSQFQEALSNIICDIRQTTNDIRRTFTATPSTYNLQPRKETAVRDLAILFESVASRRPESFAIQFFNSFESSVGHFTSITYRQLDELSNRIANLILSRGAQPGDIIAIIMKKSIMLYASILAIMKAKCAYLPLLPSTPTDRIRTIFHQAKPTLCIIDDQCIMDGELKLPNQSIDVISENLLSFSKDRPVLAANNDYLAYVIYTSGTTGVPKGVAVTQRNIVSNVDYLKCLYPQSHKGHGKLLQACSQAFDVSVFEIFYSWHSGMCLCSAANDDLFADLEHSIRVAEITHLSLTPTVASLINSVHVPTVEFLVTSGEPMTQAVLDKWGSILWQGYGPSETTNICTVKQMNSEQHIEHLGWVFPNTSVVVLFPDSLTSVPIGWVGEFCFGGEQVAAGYLNMEQMTKAKFIKHPQYGRLYRSGDMGRMLPDGSLIIIGRLDSQLKLRGQRIEAAEINSIVTAHEFVDTAETILARRDSSASDELVTFYTRQTSASFDLEQTNPDTQASIFASLSTKVPAYMIPSYVIPVSSIPRTSSGKVDRRQLQVAFSAVSLDYLERASNKSIYEETAEWTATELQLASALSGILNLKQTSIRQWTPFVTLGIDSISAIRISKRVKEHIKLAIPVSALLQYPSVAQLGRYLDSVTVPHPNNTATQYFPPSAISAIHATFHASNTRLEHILPCSPLQQAMLARGKERYYNNILLRLHVDVDSMKRAWDCVIGRNDILRTCFVTTRDSTYPIAQVILQHRPVVWKHYDVDAPSLDGAIGKHQRALGEPLDSNSPPMSLAIIRYKGSHFLSFICHHALYDGVAMDLLWREVEATINTSALPPPVSYKSFIQEAVSLPSDTSQFWRHQFESFHPTTLFPRKDRGHIGQSFCSVSLDTSLNDIQTQARSLGVSLLSLCQATWSQILLHALQTPDVCFGNVMSGRTIPLEDIDRLVAPCFNTVPIRKGHSSSAQSLQLVKYFHQQNNQLLPYQFTPLRDIQKIVGARRRTLFDTLLLVQQPLKEMDNSVWTLEADSGVMDVPLVCEVIPCPNLNSVLVNIHYDMSTVTSNVASAFRDLFKATFDRLLQDPFSNLLAKDDIPTSIQAIFDTLKPKTDTTDPASEIPDENHLENGTISHDESLVVSILSELSGVSQAKIKPTTTIFHLGLDSINAVQVASMIRERGYQLSGSDVVDCRSCQRIARRMGERKMSAEPTQSYVYDFVAFEEEVKSQFISTPGSVEYTKLLPCTPMQTAMLNAFEQSTDYKYLNCISFSARNDISATYLAKAWHRLTESQPILRTGFQKIQHRDAAYAMIQWYGLPVDVISVEAKLDKPAVENWKANQRREIKAKLNFPAWRVLLNTTSSGIDMHLLIHHALYDADSLRSMLCYLNTACNETLSPSSVIYPGLSQLLRHSLHESETSKAFWEGQTDNLVINQFPVMTPLREQSRQVLTEDLYISQPHLKVQGLVKKLGVTMQAAIQAAWTRILSSYLGEKSVSFGVSLSSRMLEDTHDSPLPCLSTVPVIGINYKSNLELLKHMMDFNTQMYEHQHTPLSKIQRWLGHPASPVFDTLVAYQKPVRDSFTDTPWSVTVDDAIPEYPVSLEVEPKGDKLLLRLTYFSDVLPPQQARLLLRQFDATFLHLLQHPEANKDSMSLLHENLFSMTPAEVPVMNSPVRLLHEFVEAAAEKYAFKTALEFVHTLESTNASIQRWNFKELNEQGNRVANLLSRHVTAGDIVGIHFDKCPEAYFAILGILKSGCSFVALDPSAPESRKQFILQDSQAPCLLTINQNDLGFTTPCRVIDITGEILEAYSPLFSKLTDLSPDSTCYCLYTSGTTGTPKGCEITHDNAVQAMMAFTDLFKGHWDPDSKWLQFASLHFDVSVLEQYWSWSVGMTLVGAKKDLILGDLAGFINTLSITHIDLTPSLARLIHPDDVPSLCRGVFITGGESLKQEILDAWGPAAVIYNAYGPTEATIGVTMFQRVPQNGRPSNIGKQFLNVGSYVVHQGTEIPVLRGGVGELCVQGKLVGKGYLHRPELTDERFPTFSRWNERVYRTGDLVRILHDGCFDFLGRADDQVKLRGQRLEIGEINHCIRIGVPSIKDVATLVLKHMKSGKDMLVCFIADDTTHDGILKIIPDNDKLLTHAKLACQDKLPVYMVPSYFLRLSFMPLSANNKLEAKELKALFSKLSHEDLLALSTTDNNTSPVQHGTEQNLCSELSAFCEVEPSLIDGTTNIFDLGIDSITVIQLSVALRKIGFAAASPGLILRHPAVRDLAAAFTNAVESTQLNSVRKAKQLLSVCHHKNISSACEILQVEPDMIEYIAPSSALQQGMISRALTTEDHAPYFNRFYMRLDETLSVSKLRLAWEGASQSDGIMRTAFINTPSGSVQVALKQKHMVWEDVVLEKDGDMEKTVSEKYSQWLEKNKHHVVCPLEFLSLSTIGGQRYLVIFIFHALYDGISFDNMLQEVFCRYDGRELLSRPLFLDTLTHGPLWNHDSAMIAWKEYLAHWRPTSVTPSEEMPSADYTSVTKVLEFPELQDICSVHKITLQSALLASWANALQCLALNNVTIGTIVSGRAINLPDVERSFGPLFNTLPFFADQNAYSSSKSLCQTAQRFSQLTLINQHIPLKDIQRQCSGGRPLFDNLFTFQVDTTGTDAEVPWSIIDSPTPPDYSLALEITKLPDGQFKVHIVANESLHADATAESLLYELQKSITELNNGWIGLKETYSTQGSGQVEDADDQVPSDTQLFQWDSISTLIREEVCGLAKLPFADVHHDTTMTALGLDSVDVIQLASRLKRHDVIVAPSKVMKLQTIQKIVSDLSLKPTQSSVATKSHFLQLKEQLRYYLISKKPDVVNLVDILPATALQESMITAMLRSNFSQYFNHEVFKLDSSIDIMKLKSAWITLAKCTPILRTTFAEISDPTITSSFCQVVHQDCMHTWETLELRDGERLDSVMELARHQAVLGDLKNGLLQLRLVTVGGQRVMMVSMAHALYDGWSLSLLYQRLWQAYNNIELPNDSAGEYLSHYFESMDGSRSFWASYLAGVKRCVIPIQENSPLAVRRYEGLSSQNMVSLKEFCKANNSTLQSLLQACWAVVLACRTGSLDVVFGTVLSGRDFTSAEDLIFPTMNTVALRCILHGTSVGFLSYVEEMMSDIRQHQSYPLRQAQTAAAISGQDLFNSLFILQKRFEDNDTSHFMKSVDGSAATDYPVCIEAEALNDSLVWRVATSSTRQANLSPEAIFTDLNTVLEFIINNCDSDILEFTGDMVSICGLSSVSTFDNDTDQALPAPSINETWNETSVIIRRTLSQVSGVSEDTITPAMTLFHLGLDSISAIKVAALLREQGMNIGIQTIMQGNSIHAIADEYCHGQSAQKNDVHVMNGQSYTKPLTADMADMLLSHDIDPETVDTILPASALQTYMMTVWYKRHGTVFMPEFTYTLNSAFSSEHISKAWNTVVQSTPMLRAQFIASGKRGMPIIQVITKSSVTIQAPLAQLIADDDDLQRTIRLRVHHALYDAFSLQSIIQRLSMTLQSHNVPTHSLEPWSRYITSITADDQDSQEFWSRYLAGYESTPSYQSIEKGNKQTSSFTSSAMKDARKIKRLAADNGVTLQALFFAVYAMSLAARYNIQRVVFGIYLANRSNSLDLPQSYPTLNLVPLRAEVLPSTDIVHLAKTIQADLIDIGKLNRSNVALWQISKWTGVKITSFVNFLSSGDSTSDEPTVLTLQDAAPLPTAVAPDVDIHYERMAQSRIADDYPPAVDIEVAARGDGLDLGVFGPAVCISTQDANLVMNELVSRLKACT